MSEVWLLIGIIILIVLIVMKIANKKQELAIKLVIILFVFFMLSGGYVYVKSNSSVDGVKDVANFSKAYFVWLGKVFVNTKEISGYIGKQNWNIENKTNEKDLNTKSPFYNNG